MRFVVLVLMATVAVSEGMSKPVQLIRSIESPAAFAASNERHNIILIGGPPEASHAVSADR